MSFFDRQGIQEALLRNLSGTTDDDGFENDVNTLHDYSFITVTKKANTFEMHNLIQLVTCTWLAHVAAYLRLIVYVTVAMPGYYCLPKSRVLQLASLGR
jgi:hypothetical protein